ncbi:DUF427 domain-containing protein [Egicoccus sp. AB-alg2]|uniref:DUF427 domain-containing protein n=1 Tax=Egicoccus sp. AB-alg2 TaxID=3242693 RepID=UPI00359D9544
MRRPRPERPGPGQESVWDYPRPPTVDPSREHVRVWFAGRIVGDSHAAVRVCETSHPPVYYLPREDVDASALAPTERRTWCEFKGQAAYADLLVEGQRSAHACWWYPRPTPGYEVLTDRIAFYPQRVERITVDDETVRSVQGDFYGGWITSRVVGPFKGGPGTEWW